MFYLFVVCKHIHSVILPILMKYQIIQIGDIMISSITVKSFNFVGTKFRGFTAMGKFVDT